MLPSFDLRFWKFNYVFPEAFFLFVLLLVALLLVLFKPSKPGFKWNLTAKLQKPNARVFFIRHAAHFLGFLGLSFLILAIAGPHRYEPEDLKRMEYAEALDIMLALDISESMLALDFEPDRLGAAKRVASSFVESRPNDRIGLVLYEGEAFTACPATTDHKLLLQKIAEVKAGVLKTGQTGIGAGLGLAVSRLREEALKSKIVILMSDGVSNAGQIDPYTAAELAKEKGVKVYTIGIGSQGTALFPTQTVLGTRLQRVQVEIDEKALKHIAERTGGKYYRATNLSALEEIYAEIDQLEKTEVYSEFSRLEIPTESANFYLTGLVLLILSLLFSKIILKGIAHE